MSSNIFPFRHTYFSNQYFLTIFSFNSIFLSLFKPNSQLIFPKPASSSSSTSFNIPPLMVMDYFYNVTDHQIIDDAGDDLFYAELERRILVLINTSDETRDSGNSYCSKGHRTSFLDQNYFDWTETDNYSSLVPATILNSWRSNNHNVNGTGVFIPRMVKSKRKNKTRKKKSENERAIYKPKVKAVANKS